MTFLWRARTIDAAAGETHLTGMGTAVTVSSKGQIVIPKEVRDALGIEAGGTLMLERVGNRLILEAAQPARERISYQEFRRRVPPYQGQPVAAEDMTDRIGELFADWDLLNKA